MKLGEFEVHPTAARFPLLDEDQLAALAADIKRNGLVHPVVLSSDGHTIVDGRNRYLACEQIEVEPKYHKLSAGMSEAEIINYIISENMQNRHLNPGQLAIIAVEALRDELKAATAATGQSEAEVIGAWWESSGLKSTRDGWKRFADYVGQRFGISDSTIKEAIKVVDSARLRKSVMTGEMRLHEAYKLVCASERSHATERAGKTSDRAQTITLFTHLGREVHYPKPAGKPKFNETNEHVSWASWTWNPVTGCLHGCKYCYAREMAETRQSYRASYPVGFTPLFHHERLDAPQNMTLPSDAEIRKRPQLKRVFVCSMADLYGKWVPDDWIEKVHASCIANPQWEYLMLTKFPRRYVGMKLPKTAWLGTSVDEQKRVRLAEEAFRQIKGVQVKWLSLEPLLAPLQFSDLSMFDWIVIGSQTQTDQPKSIASSGSTPAFAPPFEWVARLVAQARECKVPVYLKPNLLGETDNQHPGMELPREAPRGISL